MLKTELSRILSTLASGLNATIAILSIALIAGCASSRVLPSPATDERSPTRGTARAIGGMSATLERVIVRDGPGSWVKKADWDEYVMIVANGSSDVVTVNSIELSSSLVPASRHSTSRESLEKDSATALDGLEATALVIGSGVGAPVAVALAAPVVGATGWAVLGLAIIAVPVALVGSGVYVYNRFERDREDRVLVEREIERRGYKLPICLEPGTQRRSSAFFPITPAPTRVTIVYEAGGAQGKLDIDLAELSRLHLAPASR
jgi:hypothetical protein